MNDTTTTVTVNPDPYNFSGAVSTPDPHTLYTGQPQAAAVDDDRMAAAYADAAGIQPAAVEPVKSIDMTAHLGSIRAACQFPEITAQLKPMWMSRLEEIKFNGFSDVHVFTAAIAIANRQEPISIELIAAQLAADNVLKLGPGGELSEKWTATDVEKWVGPLLHVDIALAALAFVRNGVNAVEWERETWRVQTLGTTCPLPPSDYILELRKSIAKLQVLNQSGGQPTLLFQPLGDCLGDEIPVDSRPIIGIEEKGLLRAGEVLNVTASSKLGKSFLALHCGMSIASGQTWMGQFPCSPGRVLWIDTEMRLPTLRCRAHAMQKALGLTKKDMNNITLLSLRGKGIQLVGLLDELEQELKPGQYDLVIVDSLYVLRAGEATEAGQENDNAQATRDYLRIQTTCERLDMAAYVVCHQKKGGAADSSASDSAVGGGSAGRASDVNVSILRHETDGIFVVRIEKRSFAATPDYCLREDRHTGGVKILIPVEGYDPEKVARGNRSCIQSSEDAVASVLDVAERVARECTSEVPTTRVLMLQAAKLKVGLGREDAKAAIDRALEQNFILKTGTKFTRVIPPSLSEVAGNLTPPTR